MVGICDQAERETVNSCETASGKRITVKDAFRGYPSVNAAVRDYLPYLEKNFPKAYGALTKPDSSFKDFVSGLLGGVNSKRYGTDSGYEQAVSDRYIQVSHEFKPKPMQIPAFPSAGFDVSVSGRAAGGFSPPTSVKPLLELKIPSDGIK